MESKLIAMILGVALVLATATVYTQSAFVRQAAAGGDGGQGGAGGVFIGSLCIRLSSTLSIHAFV